MSQTIEMPLTPEVLLSQITPENLHGEIDFGKPVDKGIIEEIIPSK